MKTKLSFLGKIFAYVLMLNIGCLCVKVIQKSPEKQESCSNDVEEDKSAFSMNWFLIGFNEELQFVDSNIRECFSKQAGVFKWMDYITDGKLVKGEDIISYYFIKETQGQTDLKIFFTNTVKPCYDQLKLQFDKSVPAETLMDKTKFYKKYNTSSRSIGKLFAILFKLKYIYEKSVTALV